MKLPAPAAALVFDRKGRFLAVEPESAARLWEMAGDRKLLDLAGGRAAYLPERRLLATASGTGDVNLWSLPGLARRATLPGARRVGDLAFSPRGDLLAVACGDSTVRVFDLDALERPAPASAGVPQPRVRPRVLSGHAGPVTAVALSPDGGRLATASQDGTVRLWSFPEGRVVAVLSHPAPVRALAWTSDGKLLVTGSDTAAHLWSAAEARELARLSGVGAVQALAVDPAGRLLATATSGCIRLSSFPEGRPVRDLKPVHAGRQWSSVAFDPLGEFVAARESDGGVHVWTVGDGQPVSDSARRGLVLRRVPGVVPRPGWRIGQDHRSVRGPGEEDPAVAWSLDRQWLAIGGRGRTWLWAITTDRPVAEYRGDPSIQVWAVAFDPRGRFLVAASGNEVHLWPLPP